MPEAPTPAGVVAVIARVDLSGESFWLHPSKGVVSARSFPDHLIIGSDRTPGPSYLASAGTPAHTSIQGRLKIEPDGTAAGELKLRLKGSAYDPERLRSADEQKAFLSGLVGKVVEGLTLDSFSISTLSDAEFHVAVTAKVSKPLPMVGSLRRLILASEFPFTASVPIPLAAGPRRLSVELQSPVIEELELRLELPEGHRPSAVPSDLERTAGEGGKVELRVTSPDGGPLTVRRVIRIESKRLAPSEFLPLREALNELRADSSRVIIFGK
jgi:hypothetical protein